MRVTGRRKRSLKKKPFKVSKKVKTYVAKAVSHVGERKFRTVIGVGAAVAGTPVTVVLNAMVRGTARTQRDANQITMYGIRFRIELENFGILAAARSRFMVIQDRSPNGAVTGIVPTDYLEGYAAGNDVVAPYDYDKTKRYKILRDKTWVLQPSGGATDQPRQMTKFVNIRWKKGLKIQYNQGNTGLIDDLHKNSLYMVFFSDSAVGVAHNVATTIFWRDA